MPKQLTFGSDDVKAEATGFSVYEGPEPTPGVYNGVLKNLTMRTSKAGNPYFDFLIEFEGNEDTPDVKKEKFNGYPLFSMVVPGDSELQQIRVAQLMNVLSGKTKASVTLADDEDSNGRTKVTKVGGKTVPAGVPVKCSIQRERDNRDEQGQSFRMRLQDLFPRAASTAKVEKVAETTPQGEVEPVEEEVEENETPDLDELREELEGLKLLDLKKRAKEVYEFSAEDLKGKKAPDLIDEIIALYAAEESEGEEEPEDEEDEGSERREELLALKLPAIKREAKELGATIADLKGLDVAGVADWIIAKEGEETDGDDGDEAAEKDEDGLWLYDAAFGKERSQLIEMLVEAGYDADDFEDEEEYDQEALCDTLVDEGVVGAKSETAF